MLIWPAVSSGSGLHEGLVWMMSIPGTMALDVKWFPEECTPSKSSGGRVPDRSHEWLLDLRALWKSLMLRKSLETELLSHASWNHLESTLDIVTQTENETVAAALSELNLVRVLRGSISRYYPQTFLTPYLDGAHIRLNLESRRKSDSSCQRKPSDTFCMNDILTFALTRFLKRIWRKISFADYRLQTSYKLKAAKIILPK